MRPDPLDPLDPLREFRLDELGEADAGRGVQRVIFLCRRADVWRGKAHGAMERASLLALTALLAVDRSGWWWLAAVILACGASAFIVTAWRCRRLARLIDQSAERVARGEHGC